jgi:cytochrome c553
MQREPWQACLYCHNAGPEGGSASVPRIHGQSAGYIRKQLADYREGRRHDPDGMMRSALVLLEPQDEARVARHVASLPGPAVPTPNGSPGWRLFTQGRPGLPPCSGCHDSPAADPGHPRLQGQHRDYLLRQLAAFRDGRRHNDSDGVMRAVATALTEVEIEALADALAGD